MSLPGVAPLVAALALLSMGPAAALPAVDQASSDSVRSGATTPDRGRTAAPDTLRGRAILGPDSTPLAGITVALHRITTDSAGVSDSVTTDAEGRFTFPLERSPGERIVYLASTRYSGVVYLGPPLHDDELPERYRIQAFDVLPVDRSDTLTVATRHIVVLREDEGIAARDLIDVANPTTRTLVSGTDDGPWWELSLPGGISEPRVLAGGSAFAEVEITTGAVLVDGDIPPGGRRVPIAYRLPASASTEWRLLHPTRRVEMHVREDLMPAEVTGLEPAGTSRIGGESYRRYAGAELAGGDAVTLTLGDDGGEALLGWVFLGLGGVFTAGAVFALRRRRTGPADA